MQHYSIVTDSGSDISGGTLKKWGVSVANLTFQFDGDNRELVNADMPIGEFYSRMREGGMSRTAAVNPDGFKALFTPELEAGKDVLCLTLSGGISNTADAAAQAGAELAEEYPDRKIVVIDSLCASAGLALLIYLALKKRKEGATIEENAAYIRETIPHLCHWFTVDDLKYLCRNGRVSASAAFAAGLLGIRPVLHVDDEGKLINMFKARGRKKSLRAMADKYTELALDPEEGIYFISHGDCLADAKELEAMIQADHGHRATLITDIGPVIGSHSGPGTLALFFLGKER